LATFENVKYNVSTRHAARRDNKINITQIYKFVKVNVDRGERPGKRETNGMDEKKRYVLNKISEDLTAGESIKKWKYLANNRSVVGPALANQDTNNPVKNAMSAAAWLLENYPDLCQEYTEKYEL